VSVVIQALILINVTVFFLELGLSAQYLDRVFDMFGIVPARFTHPEWAESVTSI
jgi:membrane associated rhomboid family serine protease